MRKFLICVIAFSLPSVSSAEFPVFLTAEVSREQTGLVGNVPRHVAGLPKVKDAIAMFGMTPGFPFLPIDSDTQYVELAPKGTQQINFPLYLLKPVAKNLAASLERRQDNQDLKVTPADAKMLSVYLGFIEHGSKRFYEGSFVNGPTGEIRYLVYVDRPCLVTGASQRRGGPRNIYDLEFDRAGFHWVRLNRDRLTTITNAPTPRLLLLSYGP